MCDTPRREFINWICVCTAHFFLVAVPNELSSFSSAHQKWNVRDERKQTNEHIEANYHRWFRRTFNQNREREKKKRINAYAIAKKPQQQQQRNIMHCVSLHIDSPSLAISRPSLFLVLFCFFFRCYCVCMNFDRLLNSLQRFNWHIYTYNSVCV